MRENQFTKAMRLVTKDEFDQVFEKRCSTAEGPLIVYAQRNALCCARLGLVVSKKVGNAPIRNRWKRLIREAYRQNKRKFPALDLVCIPRGNTPPSYHEIEQALLAAVHKVRRKIVWREKNQKQT